MKKVSVLIPVYNHEKYLERFFRSLDKQYYPSIEYIAVNDGSTDNSLKLLREYEKKHKNFKVIDQENKGVTGAKRTALENADGEYIAVIESDDYICDNYISTLVVELEKTGTNICNPRYAVSLENPMLRRINLMSAKKPEGAINLSINKEYLTQINVTQCKLYRRDFYNLTDKNFRINEDLCMTYYNSALANNISFSNKAVYHYMPNSNGLVSQELSGYGIRKVKNFVYPLLELKSNFEKDGLDTTYSEEIEGIFIKNYMEHISDLILRMRSSDEKKNMICILVSLLASTYPNWKENKYFKEKFKNVELTDYFRSLAFQAYNNVNIIETFDGSIEDLLSRYEIEENKYNEHYSKKLTNK